MTTSKELAQLAVKIDTMAEEADKEGQPRCGSLIRQAGDALRVAAGWALSCEIATKDAAK